MSAIRRILRRATLVALFARSALAYDLTGGSWNNGDIVMHLQLGVPAAPLSDGASD